MLSYSPFAAGYKQAARGRENRGHMESKKQAVKLYWVTTNDHDEDWFIFAESARSAKAYHEDYEGYGKGDARSRLIVSDVPLNKFTNGEPPCHAQMRELFALGFEDAGSVPNQRSVRFEGKTYTEGMLESLVEAKRDRLALAEGERRCRQMERGPYRMPDPEAPASRGASPNAPAGE